MWLFNSDGRVVCDLPSTYFRPRNVYESRNNIAGNGSPPERTLDDDAGRWSADRDCTIRLPSAVSERPALSSEYSHVLPCFLQSEQPGSSREHFRFCFLQVRHAERDVVGGSGVMLEQEAFGDLELAEYRPERTANKLPMTH